MEIDTDKMVDVAGDKSYEVVIDWSAVDGAPQARQRVHNLFEIAMSILKQEGLTGKGLTTKQVMEALKSRKNEIEKTQESKQSNSSSRNGNAEEHEASQPLEKEIRVRLPQDMWEQIGEEARRLRISHTALARTWILEGLSSRNNTGESPFMAKRDSTH
jgi:hypothetical protein